MFVVQQDVQCLLLYLIDKLLVVQPLQCDEGILQAIQKLVLLAVGGATARVDHTLEICLLVPDVAEVENEGGYLRILSEQQLLDPRVRVMLGNDVIFVQLLLEDVQAQRLHELIGPGEAVEAVDPKHPSLEMTDLVLYKIVSKKAKVFEHWIYLGDELRDFLVTLGLEGFIDVEVDVSHEIVEDLAVLVNKLLIGLNKSVLRLFFAFQQV